MLKRVINALLIVDIGIMIFILLSGNSRIWLINSQIAFFSSTLIIFASMLSYKNMINKRLVVPEDNRDTIDKIDDPYDLYSNKEEDNINLKELIKEEKSKLKRSRLSIFEILRDSKPALSIYRLGAYGILILGFLYLNSNHILDIPLYLVSLSLPIVVVVIVLIKKN